MTSSHLFRLGKIKGEYGVLEALKHNKRTLQAKRGSTANIIATRSSLNYSLTGEQSPEEIARHAKAQMILAGIEKPRINMVHAVEVLISLPNDRHQQDTRPFFSDCFEWLKKTFAGELLSFDVHLDESAPHAHAIILPLIEGRMKGSDMVGSIGNLMRLINLFHNDVAQYYGLSRNEKKHLSSLDKETIEKLVLSKLQNDPAIKSSVWPCFRDAIHHDPLPYAEMLSIGLESKGKKVKSFVDHKRSKGKGAFIS